MKPESRNLFNKFRTLTDRSRALSKRIVKLQDNLYGKISSDDYNEIAEIWLEMYDLYTDQFFMECNLIDNLK